MYRRDLFYRENPPPTSQLHLTQIVATSSRLLRKACKSHSWHTHHPHVLGNPFSFSAVTRTLHAHIYFTLHFPTVYLEQCKYHNQSHTSTGQHSPDIHHVLYHHVNTAVARNIQTRLLKNLLHTTHYTWYTKSHGETPPILQTDDDG